MPSSEYDPVFPRRDNADSDDLERARELFAAASRPYLSSPWPWLAWAVLLPAAALATPAAVTLLGWGGALLLWSAAILAGGAVEASAFLRHGRAGTTPLARWSLRIQGNLSLIAVALSALLVWAGLAWTLPGVWLLLLGHSFYLLGGLASPALRRAGLLYQAGGLLALLPHGGGLAVFAVTTAVANLSMAAAVRRAARGA